MNILVVSPHPDDMELGCGGSVYRAAASGDTVKLLVMASAGTITMAHSGEVANMETRMEEQRVAAAILGVSQVDYFESENGHRLFAGKFEGYMAKLHVISGLDKYLKENPPDEVWLPFPSYNQDHQFTFEVLLAALRPTIFPRVKILCYEQTLDFASYPAPTEYNVYNALSEEDIEHKVKSLQAHGSQLKGRPDFNLLGASAVINLARLRGSQYAAPYAECFKLLRGSLT